MSEAGQVWEPQSAPRRRRAAARKRGSDDDLVYFFAQLESSQEAQVVPETAVRV